MLVQFFGLDVIPIIMSDDLNKVFLRAKLRRLYKGLGNFEQIGCDLNLDFADDTLLFLNADIQQLDYVKWLFESSSGLRINYAKSDLYPLNLSDYGSRCCANALGCKLATYEHFQWLANAIVKFLLAISFLFSKTLNPLKI